MSEYQRYEFMTCDRPLTPTQLNAVRKLSSHIDASSTHALIEYHWGDFKHDPIAVLHEFFDGYLYWANWGAPELAFRFPHDALSVDLLKGTLNEYDLDEFVTFTQYPDYDILGINSGELEAPDEWVDYELGPLIAIREELLDGDLRSLYVVWLASQNLQGGPDDGETDDASLSPSVPPGLGALTSAQQALADLLQIPRELLAAAAQHSGEAESAESLTRADEVGEWVTLLPPHRQVEYLAR